MTDELTPDTILDIREDAGSPRARQLLEAAADAQREWLLKGTLEEDMHPVWKDEDQRIDMDADRLLMYLNRLHTSRVAGLIGWAWIADQVSLGKLRIKESRASGRTLVEDARGEMDVTLMLDGEPAALVRAVADWKPDGLFTAEDIFRMALVKDLAFRCVECGHVIPGKPDAVDSSTDTGLCSYCHPEVEGEPA